MGSITFRKFHDQKRSDTPIEVGVIKEGRRIENPEGIIGKEEKDDG